MRLGVRMYPQTARVFDIIRSAGADSIGGWALFERAYVGISPRPTYRTLKQHIHHARQSIEDTGYRIECVHSGRQEPIYRVVRDAR